MGLRRTSLKQGPPGPPGTVTGSQAWTPGTIASGSFAQISVAVTGAVVGLPVIPPAWSAALPAGMHLAGQVTAANVVLVTMYNFTGVGQTPAPGTVLVEALTS